MEVAANVEASGGACSSRRSPGGGGAAARGAGAPAAEAETRSQPPLPLWSLALLGGKAGGPRHLSSEPLPLELLDEDGALAGEAGDLEGLLPPLPAGSAQQPATPADAAAAAGIPAGGAAGVEPWPDASQPPALSPKPVLRAGRSYRAAAAAAEGSGGSEGYALVRSALPRQQTAEAAPSPAKGASRKAAAGVASRPTTAGDGEETTASSCTASSQPARGSSWREEWTPGTAPPATPPPPPLLSADRLAIGAQATLQRLQAAELRGGPQRPAPLGRGGGGEEGEELGMSPAMRKVASEAALGEALRRLSEGAGANAALPPSLPKPRRRAGGSSLAVPAPKGRVEAERAESKATAAAPRGDFSELALSFAAIDGIR